MQSSLKEQKSNQPLENKRISPTQRIYQFAKQNDWKGLDQFLSTGLYSIDVQDGHQTAVFLLAKEKARERVDILIQNYQASVFYAVKGAASGGDFVKVEELLLRGAHIDSAAEGAASGGHFDKVNEFLRRGAKLRNVVIGASMGGYFFHIKDYLEKKPDFLSAAAIGGGIGGYFDAIKKLDGVTGVIIHEMNIGAVLGGHFDIQEIYQDDRKAELIGMASLAGHFEKVEEFLQEVEKNEGLHCAVLGAGSGGYFGKVEEFLARGAPIRSALWGTLNGGHFAMFEKLLQRYESDLQPYHQLEMLYYHFHHRKVALRSLSYFKNNKIRRRFAVEIVSTINLTLDIDFLLRKAEQINNLMQEYHIPHGVALAFVENPAVFDLMTQHNVKLEIACALSLPEMHGLVASESQTGFRTPILQIIATYLSPIKEPDTKTVFSIIRGPGQRKVDYLDKLTSESKFFSKKLNGDLEMAGLAVYHALMEYEGDRDFSLHNDILSCTKEIIKNPNRVDLLKEYESLLLQVNHSNKKLLSSMVMFLGLALFIGACLYLSSTLLLAACAMGAGIFLLGMGARISIALFENRECNKSLSNATASFFQSANKMKDLPSQSQVQRLADFSH